MVIFLIGYMASGKTTLGVQLAKSLSVPFIDLDEYIESKEGRSVLEIFADSGELYFRELEHRCLKEIAGFSDAVVSTGGGVPCFNDNMKLINENGVSIYLEATIDVLVDRLLVMGDSRPLVRGKSRDDLIAFVSEHLSARKKWYDMAQYRLDVDDFDAERLIEEVKELL